MPDSGGNTSSKLVNSVALTLVARGAMIIAAGSLPVAGWMIQRSLDNIQKVSDKVDAVRDQTFDTNGAIKLIQQSQSAQSQILADHELRVRTLESFNRARMP